MDDLSYDELVHEQAPSPAGQRLTALVVLLIAALGAPQVWDVLRRGEFGPALLYFPVLCVALAVLAVRRRQP